jgi:hypothetical protein
MLAGRAALMCCKQIGVEDDSAAAACQGHQTDHCSSSAKEKHERDSIVSIQ